MSRSGPANRIGSRAAPGGEDDSRCGDRSRRGQEGDLQRLRVSSSVLLRSLLPGRGVSPSGAASSATLVLCAFLASHRDRSSGGRGSCKVGHHTSPGRSATQRSTLTLAARQVGNACICARHSRGGKATGDRRRDRSRAAAGRGIAARKSRFEVENSDFARLSGWLARHGCCETECRTPSTLPSASQSGSNRCSGRSLSSLLTRSR